MSRVIKFKARRSDGKGWVKGYYRKNATLPLHYIQSDNFKEHRHHEFQIEPNTVCQLLGIEDGIEIYEGDIEEGVENEHHNNAKCKILYSIDGFRPVFQEWDFQENKWGENQTLGNLIGVVPSGNIHDEK